MVVFSFFFFIQEKTLFVAKNVTIKVMGVIAVQFQFWFQFNRHNKTQTRPPPTSSPCPAVLIGRGAVHHCVRSLGMVSPASWWWSWLCNSGRAAAWTCPLCRTRTQTQRSTGRGGRSPWQRTSSPRSPVDGQGQKGFGKGWRERLRWAESHSLTSSHCLPIYLSAFPYAGG